MKIGKTIADLRKQNNMTQSEVADILGVTYQAVSKWERDESLPDITLLPQIADLFHVSIDQLLRGFEMKSDEVECAKDIIEESQKDLSDEITQLVNESFERENPSCDELSELIGNYMDETFSKTYAKAFENLMPMMKPKKIKEMMKKQKVHVSSFTKDAFDYFDDDVIESMVENLDEVDEEIFDKLVYIVSCANSSMRDLVIEKMCNCELCGLHIAEMMPYLNSRQKTMLLSHALKNEMEEGEILEMIPFLNSESKDLLLDYIVNHDLNEEIIEEILPFLNSNHKDKLIHYLCENEKFLDYEEMLPFFTTQQNNRLIMSKINQMDMDTMIEYSPFLGKEAIHTYVMNYIHHENKDDISDLYPYMNQETKAELMKYYIKQQMIDELTELCI